MTEKKKVEFYFDESGAIPIEGNSSLSDLVNNLPELPQAPQIENVKLRQEIERLLEENKRLQISFDLAVRIRHVFTEWIEAAIYDNAAKPLRAENDRLQEEIDHLHKLLDSKDKQLSELYFRLSLVRPWLLDGVES